MQFPKTLDEAKQIANATGRPVFQRGSTGVLLIPSNGEETKRLDSYPNYIRIYERNAVKEG